MLKERMAAEWNISVGASILLILINGVMQVQV